MLAAGAAHRHGEDPRGLAVGLADLESLQPREVQPDAERLAVEGDDRTLEAANEDVEFRAQQRGVASLANAPSAR